MDPRRFLIIAAGGLCLSGCALFHPGASGVSAAAVPATALAASLSPVVAEAPVPEPVASIEIVTPAEPQAGAEAMQAHPEAPAGTPYAPAAKRAGRSPDLTGRGAIAAANRSARAPSVGDDFVGGVQVFAWSPGRVFEVWAAPLRVTTLTLAPGETLQSKAAGDTVRWQIGEASSGSGAGMRTHVMLKPLERGLETNLILTTNRRIYLIDLKSGSAEAFNAAVAWDSEADTVETPAETRPEATEIRVPDPVVMPEGPLDARYRIEPQGRRARWTPTSVFNDGRRTFITFDPDLQVDEAPALFVIAPDGEAQMVNYRQVGGLFIVDRVFDQAELRLGDRRPQIVRIRHLPGGRS
jgi:P-type conjugative transfer protein TrbG